MPFAARIVDQLGRAGPREVLASAENEMLEEMGGTRLADRIVGGRGHGARRHKGKHRHRRNPRQPPARPRPLKVEPADAAVHVADLAAEEEERSLVASDE